MYTIGASRRALHARTHTSLACIGLMEGLARREQEGVVRPERLDTTQGDQAKQRDVMGRELDSGLTEDYCGVWDGKR